MPATLALIVAFAPQSSGFFSPVAGTVGRIPAEEIEALVVKCVRGHLNGSTEIENTPLIHDHVVRVEVQSHQLVIELANPKGANPKRKRSRNVIEVPWHKTPSTQGGDRQPAIFGPVSAAAGPC